MIVFTSVFVLYSFIVNARIISSIDNLNYGLLLFVLLSILFREIFIIICTNYINNDHPQSSAPRKSSRNPERAIRVAGPPWPGIW